MKFLKKIFKKQKKYKITLTEDEIFLLGPSVLRWMEDCDEGLKEENCNDKTKESYKRDMRICYNIIQKIKEADGSNKYWKKFWKKYK